MLCVVTVMRVYCILKVPHEDSYHWIIQFMCFYVVLRENCAIAEGCLLEVSWGMTENEAMLEWMLQIHLVQRSIVYTCCGATHVVTSACWRGFCHLYMHWHEKICPIELAEKESN